jgi:hypothetical protein
MESKEEKDESRLRMMTMLTNKRGLREGVGKQMREYHGERFE